MFMATKNFLEITIEITGWLRIMLSPFLIGLVVGGAVYFGYDTLTARAIGIIIAVLGLTIGIVWANRQWKKTGTIAFLSRIEATPELEDKE